LRLARAASKVTIPMIIDEILQPADLQGRNSLVVSIEA
jgi:hypothetical protein